MVRTVLVARKADLLPLAASTDEDEGDAMLTEYKGLSREYMRRLQEEAADRVAAHESKAFHTHYLIKDGVIVSVICEHAYPRKLAMALLADLYTEFARQFPPDAVNSANRPYAFIKFDNTIQKVKRSFADVRAKENVSRLQQELNDVASIMSTNIQEVLERGNKLDQMSLMSSNLAMDSRKYMQDARYLNLRALYRKYGFIAAMVLAVVGFLYLYIKLL